VKNANSEARLLNTLHGAKLEATLIQNKIDQELGEVNLLRSRAFAKKAEKIDLIKNSGTYKELEKELTNARNESISYFNENKKLNDNLASIKGRKLVNSRGKLSDDEIKESQIFKSLSNELDREKETNRLLAVTLNKSNEDLKILANEIVKILNVALDETSFSPAKREKFERKIGKLIDGDILSLPSILVDMNF
jgi:hypothetical protein